MLSKSDKYQLLKAHTDTNVGKKSTKSGGHSNSGGCRNNGHSKWKYNITILDKKVMNQKRQMSVFNTEAKPGLGD